MMRRFFLLVCLCLAVFSAYGCTYVDKISAEDIRSITVEGLETGESLTCSEEQIRAFAEAYNSAALYTNDAGTTHPCRADVTLSDGGTLTVWGGTQGFCTMESEAAGQQNIKSQKLDEWFSGLREH